MHWIDGDVAKYWFERQLQVFKVPEVFRIRLDKHVRQVIPIEVTWHVAHPTGQLAHIPFKGIVPDWQVVQITFDDPNYKPQSMQNVSELGQIVHFWTKSAVVYHPFWHYDIKILQFLLIIHFVA